MNIELQKREYWEFKRGADEYLEIENFKDYELTQCLAFEMFRRTKNFESYKRENFYPFKDLFWTYDDIEPWRKKTDKVFYFRHRLKDIGVMNEYRSINLSIIPLFARPVPIIPKHLSREVKITLNLALPKGELIAYISEIKDNYDKDHTTISFGREVEPSNALDEIKRRNAAGKLKNAKKMPYADMFFIYDCLSAASNDEIDEAIGHITDEIKDYYTQKIMESENMSKMAAKQKARNIDPKTIRKFFKIMQDFIDNERYKELLTGEKVE